MKEASVIEIIKSTLDLPLTDTQKIILIRQLFSNLEYREKNN
jgi:hypothetical protein